MKRVAPGFDGVRLYLWLTPLLACLSLINIARDLGQPFGGFISSRFIHDAYWQVDVATPPWWPGVASPDGLRFSDRPLRFDGQPADFNQREIFAAAAQSGVRYLKIQVQEGGSGAIVERQVPIAPFTLADLLDYRLSDLILFISLWLLAWVVFQTQPHDPTNRIVAFMFCTLGLGHWLIPNAVFFDRSWLDRLIEYIAWCIVSPLTGPALVHFGLHYPTPSRWLRRATLVALYGSVLLVNGPHLVAQVWSLWPGGLSPVVAQHIGIWARDWNVYTFLAGVVFAITRIAWVTTRPGLAVRVRRRAGIFLLGCLVALPALIAVAFVTMDSLHSFHLGHLDLRYLLLGAPLAMTYGLLRYGAFRTSHPVFLTVLALASSGLVASVGDWSIQTWFAPTLTRSLFVPLFGLALALSLTWNSQTRWRGALSRLFHWERRNYTAALNFGDRLIGQLRFSQLPADLTQTLAAELELECAALWLHCAPGPKAVFELASQVGVWPIPLPAQLTPGSLPLPTGSHPYRTQDAALPTWLIPLRVCGADLVAPLSALEQSLGFLAIGKRVDQEIFDERDLEIVRLIAQQAALFLLTGQQVEALRQIPRRVAEAQEQERLRIAQELHDAIQQFLGRLPFYLEVSREAVRTDPDETDALLRECILDVKAAAQTVRQIRHNLAPRLLESGLTRPLTELVARFQNRMGVDVELRLPPELDRVLPLDARHALYRVVQQALDNVAQHARAQHVQIRVLHRDNYLEFVIADDGQGFSAADGAKASADDHFGLSSMEARLEAHGGQLHIASTPGEGTRVEGWLPLPA